MGGSWYNGIEQKRRGENMKWYPIHVKSKQLLFDLNIAQSFKQFPEIYFQVHSMENDSIHVFWRTPMSKDILAQVMHDAKFYGVKISDDLILSSKTPRFLLLLYC